MSEKSRRYYYANLNKDKKEKSVKKITKKLSAKTKVAMFLFFIIGVVASYFGGSIICKNDCFEINGKKSIVIEAGQTYVDEGVKVIAFGQDADSKVIVEVFKDNTKLEGLDQIDTTTPATYQIVYKVNSLRYKNIQLIRTITITEVSTDVPPEQDAYPAS